MTSADNKRGRYGGDMGFSGMQPKSSARNIRRLMKKYPDDKIVQEKLAEELKKYEFNK